MTQPKESPEVCESQTGGLQLRFADFKAQEWLESLMTPHAQKAVGEVLETLESATRIHLPPNVLLQVRAKESMEDWGFDDDGAQTSTTTYNPARPPDSTSSRPRPNAPCSTSSRRLP